MLAVLPDTQVYSLRVPGHLHRPDHLDRHARPADRHIPYVLHLGDIVEQQHRTWNGSGRRRRCRLLDGVVPYALVTGNHDYGPSGNAVQPATRC